MLRRGGYEVNRKRVQRLMEVMGIGAIYPRRSGSQPAGGHEIFPYLLEGLGILGPDQVRCLDLTYVPMVYGFLFLVPVMDWWSRYVLGWEISNTMETEFCIRTWGQALGNATPEQSYRQPQKYEGCMMSCDLVRAMKSERASLTTCPVRREPIVPHQDS